MRFSQFRSSDVFIVYVEVYGVCGRPAEFDIDEIIRVEGSILIIVKLDKERLLWFLNVVVRETDHAVINGVVVDASYGDVCEKKSR